MRANRPALQHILALGCALSWLGGCGDAAGQSHDAAPMQQPTRAPSAFVRPAPLRVGDQVAIIAPSNAVEPDLLLPNLEVLRAHGLRPTLRADLYARDLRYAGTPARRIAELRDALLDPAVRAIWAARGGSGAAELLAGIEPELIRQHPKWLIGFSDVSTLHAAWGAAGVMSLHGSTVHLLSRGPDHAQDTLFAQLMGDTEQSFSASGSHGRGRVQGWLTGGNLTVLATLAGTGHLPSWRGAVLLLEDIGEAPYALERALLQLHQAGALTGVVGVVLGQLTQCEDDAESLTAEQRLVRFVHTRLGLPTLTGLPFGHGVDAQAVTFGAVAQMDLDGGILRVGDG